jgi:hypothetical protein
MSIDDHTYAMDWTGMHGDTVGPVRSSPKSVHNVAKKTVTHGGGTARVLRAAGDGWREVARYTDRGTGEAAKPRDGRRWWN